MGGRYLRPDDSGVPGLGTPTASKSGSRSSTLRMSFDAIQRYPAKLAVVTSGEVCWVRGRRGGMADVMPMGTATVQQMV